MEYIRKIPLLMGISASIIVGFISYSYGVAQQDMFFRMAIAMALFFAIGIFIRSTLEDIFAAKEKKRLEEEEIEKNRIREEEEQMQLNGMDSPSKPSIVDYRVDDYGEDFSPLTVSEIINSNDLEN